jgi:hypothetical protein
MNDPHTCFHRTDTICIACQTVAYRAHRRHEIERMETLPLQRLLEREDNKAGTGSKPEPAEIRDHMRHVLAQREAQPDPLTLLTDAELESMSCYLRAKIASYGTRVSRNTDRTELRHVITEQQRRQQVTG